MIDPLTQYHMLLRSTRASGYPNMQYMAPHPYEMATGAMANDYHGPFQYARGWGMRTTAIPPRNPYRFNQQRITPGMRTNPYSPPTRSGFDRPRITY